MTNIHYILYMRQSLSLLPLPRSWLDGLVGWTLLCQYGISVHPGQQHCSKRYPIQLLSPVQQSNTISTFPLHLLYIHYCIIIASNSSIFNIHSLYKYTYTHHKLISHMYIVILEKKSRTLTNNTLIKLVFCMIQT